MDLLTKARRLESRLARTLDAAAQRVAGSGTRDPIEVLHEIVEAVEQEVVPAGRGTRVFPYNSVAVTLAAAGAVERARYEAILERTPTLRDRMVDRLNSAGADVSELIVTVEYATEPQPEWRSDSFHLALSRLATLPAEPAAPEVPPTTPIQLAVVHGAAVQSTYSLSIARIDLGRGIEVRDTRNHLMRTNHVAFTEGGHAVNASVSRRHAHITHDEGVYRIFDDGSAHGTTVQRNGTTIVVRSGSRGIRLRDGDEIVLGEARVRVGLPK